MPNSAENNQNNNKKKERGTYNQGKCSKCNRWGHYEKYCFTKHSNDNASKATESDYIA